MWFNFSFRLRIKKKKVEAAGVSLSKAYAFSEQHPLSEALSSLSGLGESRRESAKHACAQRTISSSSESSIFSGAQRAQLAKLKFTNSRLAQKWH